MATSTRNSTTPAQKAATADKKAATASGKPGKPAAKKKASGAKTDATKPALRKGGKVAVDAPGSFEGFPKDFLAFFREIAKHNDREWFALNKERYKTSVQQPTLAFIAAMDLPLGRIADCFVADARPQGGSMFRIYRDVRFGHDKSPYKDYASCQFRHMAGKDAHAPGFYVQLEPNEVIFGGGIWRPPGPELRAIREAIAADPERWTKITKAPAFRRRFGDLEGESLKRPPQGFDPEHPLIDVLKQQSFFAMQTVKPEAILSKGFVTEVAKAFAALGPFMEFLTAALGLPFHLDD